MSSTDMNLLELELLEENKKLHVEATRLKVRINIQSIAFIRSHCKR